MKKNVLIALALLITGSVSAQKNFTLSSPDGKLQVRIAAGSTVEYSVLHGGDVMVAPSDISMTLEGVPSFGTDARLAGSSTRSVDNVFDAAVYKRSRVNDNFNELTLKFKGNYEIVFRAYDDGAAYRFRYTGKKPFNVLDEQAEFAFPADADAVYAYVYNGGNGKYGDKFEKQFGNSFENHYTYATLSEWDPDRLAFLPLVVGGPNGKKVCITEADLMDYPGMYLYCGDASGVLTGVYATYPKAFEQGGYKDLQMFVTERENYIAKVNGATDFPWRVAIVAADDAELADSDMVYKLSTPAVGDFSWVKPGKAAWDWWNSRNLYGVDFESGINNDTFKYYVDFASEQGIEYMLLDSGWAVSTKVDLMEVIPELDLPMLVDYAAERNVGIILWAGYQAFENDMENVCRHYADMGIKGFKVDFMDRDDQPMVDFHRRAAHMSAKYGLMMDFHGTYKPAGLNRTYPNVVTFEGVLGMEQMKWSTDLDHVTYDVTIPFVRMVAGPMDYTQGAMRNATKTNYHPIRSEAMSQGTRCHQLAEYVIFESPLSVLCDSPSNYMNEPECIRFIADIPTVWDETVALNGEIARYVSIARRSGPEWYVGSLNGWDARELVLDLSFLGAGEFAAEVYRDGVNAAKVARDHKKETIDIPADRRLTIKMAPGGGFAARIYKK